MKSRILVLALVISAAFLAPEAATVSGVVKDSVSNSVIQNALVSLRRGTSQQNFIRDTTDENGVFSFANVADSVYTIRISATGYVTKTTAAITVDGSDQTVNVLLSPVSYGKVSGTITDSVSGSALAGALVTLRVGGQVRETDTTDSDGKYEFDSVSTGVYNVRATLTSYATRTVDSVTVSSNQTTTTNIALPKVQYAQVSGTVTDSSTGTPLVGAVVSISGSGAGGGSTRRDTTNAEGKYSFDSVAAGQHTLIGLHSDYAARTVELSVAGTNQVVDLKLLRAQKASLKGVVTDSVSGAPVSGAVISVRLGTGGGSSTLLRDTTGQDGAYSFDSIMTGDYTIRVQDSGYATKYVDLYVRGTDQITVNVAIAPPSTAIQSPVSRNSIGLGSIQMVGKRIVRISNFGTKGTVSILSANGRVLLSRTFEGEYSNLLLPRSAAGEYIVTISTAGKIYSKRIMLP